MNSSLMLSQWGRKVARKLLRPFEAPKQYDLPKKWTIVRGDEVEVINGPNKGERGKVKTVIRRQARVIVEGVNMKTRIIKPKMDGTPGKKVLKPVTIHYSNILVIDPSTNKPTKTSRRYLEDGTEVRVSKDSGHVIPKPHPLFDRTPRPIITGPKDTAPKDVFAVTFPNYAKYLPYIYGNDKKKILEEAREVRLAGEAAAAEASDKL